MPCGVNVDPENPSGRPAPSLLRELGVDYVRLVLRPAVLPYIEECHAAGLAVLGVLARESGDPAQYVGWPLDAGLQVGNEPDGQPPSSWVMSPSEYYGLWYRVRDLFPGVPLIGGALVSGNPYKGEQYWSVEGISAIAVHPYGRTAPAARLLLRQYRELSELPIVVTEWHRPAAEIPEFAAMLAEETESAAWFSWHDFDGWTGGLLDGDGQPKAEYHALVEVMRDMATLSERIALLEKQQAMTVDVLRLMLEGRWQGEFPHAEAILKAINPADTDWSAVPFPLKN